MERMSCSGVLRIFLVLLTVFAVGGASGQTGTDPAHELFAGPIRGITISCFRNGPGEWDGPDMPATLDELAALGANWVTIHPYARISQDGALRWSDRDADTVEATARLAHERGMKVMIKPHLAYWRTGFAWRGDIAFDNPEDEARFWRDYERWIIHHAELAETHGVDLLAVGTELKQLSNEGHEAVWRGLIAKVRQRYAGPLTYAANWDEYEHVRFWDALDIVGIQAYFALGRGLDGPPDYEGLPKAWARQMTTMRKVRNEHGKPVVFTELGYALSTAAALRPWEDDRVGDAEAANTTKLRCMAIALEAVEGEPAVAGAFLWKWFATPREFNREFVLQYPAMKRVIRNAWVAPDLN